MPLCVYVCMCLCMWESERKCACWCVLPHWKALLFTCKKLLFVFRYIISFVLFPPNCSCFLFLCSHRTCLRHLEIFLHLFLFFMVLCFYYICLSCLYSTLFITCGVSTSLANSHYFIEDFLYSCDFLFPLYFPWALSNLSSQLRFWKYSGIFGHLLVTLFHWVLRVTYCYFAAAEFHQGSQDVMIMWCRYARSKIRCALIKKIKCTYSSGSSICVHKYNTYTYVSAYILHADIDRARVGE